jgi:RHS repeat-associated protein
MHFTGKQWDAETNLDYFGARYDASSMGRFMTPDPLGGHTEDPQTLNRYAYVRNNPLNLTDPTGLDFYLTCQQNDKNASTCQQQRVGGTDKNPQMAWVQGVTGKDGFKATQIGNENGNLVDKTTGTGNYSASVNGSGVYFSNSGGQTSSAGAFVNGTPETSFQDAGWANGGSLSAFHFTFENSKLEANQTAAGFFSFAGTPAQAEGALTSAGFDFHKWGENPGMHEYRSSGTSWFGSNSAHFNVNPQALIDPGATVPAAGGNMHFGEHNPFTLPFGAIGHCAEDRAGICQ